MKLLHTLRGDDGILSCTAFGSDGKVIACGSHLSTLQLWDCESGEKIITLPRFRNDSVINSLAFSPDGNKLAIASNHSPIYLWDKQSCNLVCIFNGHMGSVFSVTFSPDGKTLASASSDQTVRLWDTQKGQQLAQLAGHTGDVNAVAFSPDGKTPASASSDQTVRLWDVRKRRPLLTLEGHTRGVKSCKFSTDGQLLATNAENVRIWRTDTWKTVAILVEPDSGAIWPEIAFHPSKPILATLGEKDTVIRIWELDYSVLLGKEFGEKPVHYTTAKIALVGDSGVGKTGLGWRLAHAQFKEHSSTHGQQFWVIDELGKTRADGAECEAVLWDLAGQQDYRLVHALFLDDVDLALVLFDPGNREQPLSGVSFWLKQLSRQQKALLQTVLIGARIDRGQPTLTEKELREFCQHHNISGGYLPTSAKSGDGIETLMNTLKSLIPWDDMPATITTDTFKRIKEFVLDLKENSERQSVLVAPHSLRAQLQQSDKDWEFSDAEMMTAVKHLENHGYVTVCRSSQGETAILLSPDILVNLASSLVLAARGNPQGLGALEEHKLLSGEQPFDELAALSEDERETLLDTAAMLFLGKNLCFREVLDGANRRTFLVFPSLINEKRPKTREIATVEDVSYHVSGAVENVYAALVVLLGYTNQFVRTNQWQNQAQYELGDGQVCGFRQITEHEGEIDLILYYGESTPEHVRLIFQGLFEGFLQQRPGIKITRFSPVVCSNCRELQERGAVLKQIANQRKFIFCANCGEKIHIPASVELTPVAGVDRELVREEQAVADRRTKFEAALVRIKAILRELGEAAEPQPTCFISYAWGVPEHEKWVLRLAKDLRHADIEVLLDRWHSTPGTNLNDYIQKIHECEYVVVVGTPLLKNKYDDKKRDSVVAAELTLITSRLMEPGHFGYKSIPLLLAGDKRTAFPPLLQAMVSVDFRNTEDYFVRLFDLILTLHGIRFDHAGLDDLREEMRG